jgi:hypothetical protein
VVSARTFGAQQLGRGRLDQQRLIQRGDRIVAASGGDLHQRGRVRHPGSERDPAEPLPGDGIGHLPAQRLIAQPIPKLEKHQPQIALHRNRRATDPSIEVPGERCEEHRIVQQHVDAR